MKKKKKKKKKKNMGKSLHTYSQILYTSVMIY